MEKMFEKDFFKFNTSLKKITLIKNDMPYILKRNWEFYIYFF